MNLSVEHFNSLESKNFLELFALLDMNKLFIDKDSENTIDDKIPKVYDNKYRKNILWYLEKKKTIEELYEKINSNINLDKDIFNDKYSKEIKEKILFLSSSFIFPLSFFLNRIDNFFTIDIKNYDFRRHFLFLLEKEYKEILNKESKKNSFQEDKINFFSIGKFSSQH